MTARGKGLAMRQVGRFLQSAALVILPLAILAELSAGISVRESLTAAGFGVILFVIGWLLAGLGPPRSSRTIDGDRQRRKP